MSKIWFTSDTHFMHKNIAGPKVSSWEEGFRNFNDEIEMSKHIVKVFNQTIEENDILYHLGDWSFGGHENIKKFRDQLNCQEIHLIFGNHDQHIEPIDSPYRSLFASCQYVKEFSLKVDSKYGIVGKQKFFLSHYGHRVWNKSHHGSIHLYGHSHGTLPGLGRSMDVGVDTNNLYPYHIDEIMDIMSKIPINIVDHHNQNTN